MPLSSEFTRHFINLKDPRKQTQNKRHLLEDILVLSLLAVICGADDWVSVSQFGKDKKEWLKTFLKLPNGIPSHDTFGEVFSRLSIREFEQCFLNWINSLVNIEGGDIIAIDGKTLRRSHDRKKGHAAIHMISAWSTKNQLVLGQRKVDDKSNEITAIPELLKMLDITGSTVTIDAMGCQKKISEQIHAQGGNYVLAVKENQGKLYQAIEKLFESSRGENAQAMWIKKHETLEKDHGRIEHRSYTILPMMYVSDFKYKWKGLQSIACVEASRGIGNKIEVERRYYISSLKPQAEIISHAIRTHWCVENQLHWCMDVCFREDDSRIRKGDSAGNFSILRHIALNLLKKETSVKVGLKTKRKKAGWSHEYLAKILENA